MPNLSYANHLGESIDLTDHWHLQDGTDLNDWTVSHRTLNGRTVGFYRESGTKKLPIVMTAPTEAAGLALRDELVSVAYADIEAGKPGRLYYDGWYLECYVTDSRKSLYQYHGGVCSYELTLLVDDPMWVRETTSQFAPLPQSAVGGIDYPHDYPHDFASNSHGDAIRNGTSLDADIEITIYGACTNPRVTIGGNTYGVDVSIVEGETVTIDTGSRSIVRRGIYGDVTNVFANAYGTMRKGSGTYPFEKLPAGSSSLSWDGSFTFDVHVFERTPERRWS